MFGSQNRNNNGRRRNSLTKTLVNIATIVSTTVVCLRLTYYKIIPFQIAALIMLGTVIFVALGNNLSKIVLSCAALFLFVLYYSGGSNPYFSALMGQVLGLIIILIALYIMIRSLFRK
jgi:hypothetical protein